MKRLCIFIVTMSSLGVSAATADMLTLTPVADSTVDALDPDAAIPTGDLEATMVGAVDLPAEQLTFFYAQFQLPDGLTGQDIASINSIDLKLTRSPSSSGLSLTYYMYGVFDSLDTESADTYTWNDGVGFDPTHKDVKFLNPNNEEIFYYSDPAESGFVGFIDTSSSGPPQRQFGFFTTQAAFATQNLHDLILQDTDGLITFYGKVRQNFGVTELQRITSMEDGTRPAPTLVIDFVPGSGAIPGDYNEDGMVNAADYTVWRDTSGSITDLRANGDDTGTSMGVIDAADYEFWKANFGASGSATVVGSTAIPEPGSAALVLLAALGCAGFTRRSLRSLDSERA